MLYEVITPMISDDFVSIKFIFNNDTKDIRIDISSEYIFYNNSSPFAFADLIDGCYKKERNNFV